MKPFLVFLIAVLGPLAALGPLSAQEAEETGFSAEGKITQLDSAGQFFRFRKEGGPELTYYVEETSAVTSAEGLASFDDLAPGDLVRIEYAYDRDYRKVVKRVHKLPFTET
jgi:hypothetical protein